MDLCTSVTDRRLGRAAPAAGSTTGVVRTDSPTRVPRPTPPPDADVEEGCAGKVDPEEEPEAAGFNEADEGRDGADNRAGGPTLVRTG